VRHKNILLKGGISMRTMILVFILIKKKKTFVKHSLSNQLQEGLEIANLDSIIHQMSLLFNLSNYLYFLILKILKFAYINNISWNLNNYLGNKLESKRWAMQLIYLIVIRKIYFLEIDNKNIFIENWFDQFIY
jgi:hypothetical protein